MASDSAYRFAFEIGEAPPREGPPPARITIDRDKVERGLLKLVLSLVELIRQLLEKQAMRRIDAGSVTDAEAERLGATLMQLESKIRELQEQFGIDSLNIDLGPLGTLVDE